MLDWQTVIAIGALGLALMTLFLRLTGSSLTRYEHEEFKRKVDADIEGLTRGLETRLFIREFESWIVQFRRDIDRAATDVRQLDQTKPTTGELERAVESVQSRLDMIEERIKMYNHHKPGQ